MRSEQARLSENERNKTIVCLVLSQVGLDVF